MSITYSVVSFYTATVSRHIRIRIEKPSKTNDFAGFLFFLLMDKLLIIYAGLNQFLQQFCTHSVLMTGILIFWSEYSFYLHNSFHSFII